MDGQEPGSVPDSRLQRRTFVGRKGELQALRAAFETAAAGQGGVVMVAGEPGIGKTALCQELATFVREQGSRALFGHCYEGTLSQPYLPFAAALRDHILASGSDVSREQLGPSVTILARIVPELRDNQLESPSPAVAEEDQWRLLQSVADFLKAVAARTPLLVVLEDLHWADSGTLDLLQHLARNLANARLLVVGTYRELEVDRSHPLSAVLAELQRTSRYRRIGLRGLAVDEVYGLYQALGGEAAPRSQAELVQRQTEGNPLFVQEVLRFLIEEGLVGQPAGSQPFAANQDSAPLLPQALRDIIGRRFSRLSGRAEQLLAVASVIGRDFRLDVLGKVAALSEDDLIAALEESVRAGVLEEHVRPGLILYRFSHALFRQMLYEEISAPRRMRWHQQVAGALEEVYSRQPAEHAAELAGHFAQSNDATDLKKAIAYGEMAAERALSVFAGAEAANHLERCLELEAIVDPDDQTKRFDLLMSFGDALSTTGSARRILDEVAPAALTLAEAIQDRERCSLACRLALTAFSLLGAGPAYGTPEAKRWAQLADEYAQDGTPDRVRADIALALIAISGNGAVARERAKRAYRHALEIGDPAALSAAEVCLQLVATYFPDAELLPLALAITDKLASLTRVPFSSGDRDRERAYFFGFDVYLKAGRRRESEDLLARFEADVARRQSPTGYILVRNLRAWLAMADGQLEDATQVYRELAEFAAEHDLVAFAEAIIDLGIGRAACYLGELAPQFRIPSSAAGLLTADVYQGDGSQAAAFLRQALDGFAAAAGWELWNYIFVGEVAVKLRQEPAAQQILTRLRGLPLQLSGHSWTVCIPRLRGECAVVVGRWQEARTEYEEALSICRRLNFQPELALTELDYAELLLGHYPAEHEAAVQHLDSSIDALREMHMRPALERALQLKEGAGSRAPRRDAAPPDQLTRREVDVLVLVAGGRSNKQIAEDLVLSVRTVERHLTNAYRKIGAHSKAQATAYALSRGLGKAPL